MELAVELIFRIFIAIVATTLIIFLINYYYQKAKIDIPSSNQEKEIQVISIKNDEDMAKAIYGCYSFGNFGKLKQRIDCFIAKIQTNNLDDNNIRNILFNNFSLGDIYEKITFRNLVENTTLLIYYLDGYVRFRII